MTREELLTWIPCLEADADRRGLDTYAMVAKKAALFLQRDGERIAELESALAAMTGERDRLRAELDRLRAALEEVAAHDDQHRETCRAALREGVE